MPVIMAKDYPDGSFFTVTSPKIEDRVLTQDIISLTYSEEISRFNSGTITILDNDNYYSKVLRYGAPLELTFGWADSNLKADLSISGKDLFGSNKKTGIKAYVTNPTGGGASSGVSVFNCNFYGREALGAKNKSVHGGVTKGTLVEDLLTRIGCEEFEIKFTREKEFLGPNTQVLQRETDYRLLLRLAREWRVIFRIGYNSKGKMTGVFISPQYLDLKTLPSLFSNAIGGDSMLLEYKGGLNNVISYTWKNHQGNSGYGDNVRIITGPDGQPTFIRYVTKGETITAYKLNPDKIKDRLKNATDFSDRFAKLKEWVSAEDFEEVKWAFDPYEQETAPQGLGYTMSAKVMGMPLISSPLKIYYGYGFPVFFTPKSTLIHPSNFYCNKVSHSLSSAGYIMDLDIADAYTITGGSLI